MADSVAVFPPGARFIDASGNVLAGGSIEFYDAGTTTPKTVHSDPDLQNALGPVVYLDSGGAPIAGHDDPTKVMVYVGTDPYKVVVKDSSGVVIETKDNVAGAFNSASILESLVLIPETVVTTLTESTTLALADRGGLFNCNTTGGGFTVTLPDGTETPNGTRFGVRMAGSANAVSIRAVSGQTIAHQGTSSNSVALGRFGETYWFVCAGGNWVVDTYVPPLRDTVGIITIGSFEEEPPDEVQPGWRWIVDDNPTGDWSGFSEGDIVEWTGSGWVRIPPSVGWIANVIEEEEFFFFNGEGWFPLIPHSASQSEMESAASDSPVTPEVQHYHPGHPKMWGVVTVSGGTPSLVSSYNVSGITDTGTGRLTVTIDHDFSSADWACIATAMQTDGAPPRGIGVDSQSAGSFELQCSVASATSTLVDPDKWYFMGLGDQ